MNLLASLTAALADRYAIEREIGRGGMATVLLARDVRHDRRVAVKVLNPELGAVLGVERFLAEIKVTANLQHPNLLPLFDSGEAAGQLFYVMPFVDGESLRARLDRERQLPIDEAVRIAVAIANALEYAHGHGVIHRDLKPENILIQAGQPVVADFGIALAVSKAGGTRVTQTGLSLGTPQYMSPEQATSDRVIDGRSDIYALAAVTYEMLTGEPPHTGNTAQAILSRLLTEQPRPARSVRPTVPEHVEAALQRALEKLPADRFPAARDFAEALSGKVLLPSGREPSRIGRARSPGLLTLAPWVIALAAAAVALREWTRPAPGLGDHVIRYGVGLLPGQRLGRPLFGTASPVAISPDGRRIAYSVVDSLGEHLELRALDELRGHSITGTGGGVLPEFSPDGKWIAFVSADLKLKKIPSDGGAPTTLCDLPFVEGFTWLSNESIAFARRGGTVDRGMWRVSASGGQPEHLTQLDTAHGELLQLKPRAVEGGKYLLYTGIPGSLSDGRIGVASVQTGESRLVMSLQGTAVLGYIDHHVIYVRNDGTVMAAPLDLGRAVAGPPAPIMDSIEVGITYAAAALSANGALVYVRGGSSNSVTLVDEHGVAKPLIEDERPYVNPRLSPDGHRLALTIPKAGGTDVWLYDLRARTLERVTTEGSNDRADWTPDGKRLVYLSNRKERHFDIWWQPADASTAAEPLYASKNMIREVIATPDARGFVYREDSPTQARDLYFLPASDRRPMPLLNTPADELMPRVSPDGRWLAYISDETGAYEVYVRPFPGPGGRVAISNGGGAEPVWAPDGHRLYYRNGPKLIAATVAMTPTFTVTGHQVLFEGAYEGHPYHQNYDVTPDGRSFVMLKSVSGDRQLVMVLNWITELRKRISTQR